MVLVMKSVLLTLIIALAFSMPLHGLDSSLVWIDPANPDVMTNNNSGIIISLTGQARIKAALQSEKEVGIAAAVSDRINAGDTIITAANSRVEILSKDNVLILVGPSAKATILGIRTYQDARGDVVSRVDIDVQEGIVRMQVRENITRPELSMLDLGGAQVVLSRGDVVATGGKNWRVAVVGGSAHFRLYQGGAYMPATVFDTGEMLSSNDQVVLASAELNEIRQRYPFLYERRRAALQPAPPPDPFEDAP
jgi:hypothetical protein